MSELILPDHLAKKVASEEIKEKVAKQLPQPCGYKMLVSLPKIEEKYDSGLIKADSIVRNDEIASVVGFVISQGPDCYKDTARYPNGPYCKEGDFILMRAYAGTRFKLHDVELRLIDEDTCEAVVMDPRGYSSV